MYRYWLFFLVMFCACKHQYGNRAEIEQVMKAQVEAWNNGDLKGFMQGYWQSDSLIFTGGKSITHGWQEALNRYQKAYPDKLAMGHLSFSETWTKLGDGNSAFTVGRWQLARSSDTLSGRFTLIWNKLNDHWVIVADHSS